MAAGPNLRDVTVTDCKETRRLRSIGLLKYYRKAVEWCALNDDISEVAVGLISTLLVNDLFDLPHEIVVTDVEVHHRKWFGDGN